jgi:alpha-1,6-mannosyltransferase
MKPAISSKFQAWGGISFFAGIVILLSLTFLIPLPNLRGPQVVVFLTAYLVAAAAYFIAVIRLGRDKLPTGMIWGFAILFRILLLFTEQSLSDDVFRFIWDGSLLSQGINPYAQAVNSPLLDSFDIPVRALVNHDWMASPYLPAAQMLFLPVVGIAPESVFSFQITAVILDLLIGWLVFDSLRRLTISPAGILIYLWNPLIISEFANGAHVVDAWMIFLVILAFWLMIRASSFPQRENFYNLGVVLAMAGATLTKGLPALLVPIFLRRWRWKWTLVYVGVVLAALVVFALGAGWGILGPMNGTGVFGAMRIYMSWWNFNSGLYHWLEVGLSGYQTPGAVPLEAVGQEPILVARLITSSAILLITILTGWWAWRLDSPRGADYLTRTLSLIRLAIIPVGGYLLLTHTVHPWYVTFILPLLPFLLPRGEEGSQVKRFIWPWFYLSLAVALSYLTYFDPNDLREYDFIRLIEYLPVFLLLVWAAWPWLSQGLISIFDKGIRGERIKRR